MLKAQEFILHQMKTGIKGKKDLNFILVIRREKESGKSSNKQS